MPPEKHTYQVLVGGKRFYVGGGLVASDQAWRLSERGALVLWGRPWLQWFAMTDSNHVPGQPPQKILIAIRNIFRPLARLAISFGIPFSALTEMLKEAFVEAAESHSQIDGKRLTDSRITLLTGVHRKDVRRLRHQKTPREASSEVVSLGALAVAKWVSDSKYTDSEGRPLALSRFQGGRSEELMEQSGTPGSSEDISFESLIASVSRKDIRARVVLDEWLRLGVVRINERNQVCLCADAFVPKSGLDEKAYFLGKNIHDHLSVIVHNFLDEKPMLERCVYYDGLSAEAVNTLEELAKKEAMKALKKINQQALALQEGGPASAQQSYRFNFGSYFFVGQKDPKLNVEDPEE